MHENGVLFNLYLNSILNAMDAEVGLSIQIQ